MAGMKTEGVGDKHLLLFGTIVQRFAAHELLMVRLMAQVLGTQAASVMVLLRPLAFEEKRKTLLDLLRHRQIPLEQYDRVSAFLNVPLRLEQLRHDIVHTTWIAAQPPDSIQPAWILQPPAEIKPVHAEAGVSPDEFVEDEAEKMAYSLDDLKEAAAALESNLVNFSAFLHEVGLLDGV
jgi:hypothetical protein